MPREYVRVAVHDGAFCLNCVCRDCLVVHRGEREYVDCRRADCDNHKRGTATLPKSADEAPFALPPSETPFSPE